MTTTRENVFSTLIREDRAGWWGNWSLDPTIVPGAVGVLDPATGSLAATGELVPTLHTVSKPFSQHWVLQSEGVTRQEAKAKIAGSGTDEETGIKGEGELEISWSMKSAGSVVSEFSVSGEEYVDTGAMLGDIDWIAASAGRHNMARAGSISQGFGVVTGVVWARSGVNVASNSDGSTFTIAGKASAVKEMVGEASGSGSYSRSTETKGVAKHTWPARENEQASTPIAIAYTFASFEGRTMIERWTVPTSSFVLLLNSVTGTTYIVDAILWYDSVSESPGKTVGRTQSIGGGGSAVFGDIPVDATDVRLRTRFEGMVTDDIHVLHWPTPLGVWQSGAVRQVDLHGVWPGENWIVDVATGERA